uniref:UVR domain-containing protein n=1 Tax=Lotharella globosa TaxID=91324 RepID=A0A7S4DMP7_9EUKA
MVDIQFEKYDAVREEDFQRAQELKDQVDSIAAESGESAAEAERAALERRKREAVDREDYTEAQMVKQRLEALSRKPPMRKAAPSKPVSEGPPPPLRFDEQPWVGLIYLVSMYKSMDPMELVERLEYLRMMMSSVDITRHPKKELVCLIAATVEPSLMQESLDAIQKQIPEISAEHLSFDQLWLLGTSPQEIESRTLACRDMLLGVKNFTELLFYNPNLLDTSALSITLDELRRNAPEVSPPKWIERNLPPSRFSMPSPALRMFSLTDSAYDEAINSMAGV